jgi:4-hydroxybenzoate polyprenyltransferase
MTNILQALRPKQWIKNLLIFIPLIFSQEFLNPTSVAITFAIFGIFCLTASGVYLMNDIFDKEHDAKHPQKKDRAIASEKISIKLAIFLTTSLFTISLMLACFVDFRLASIILLYLILQFAYSAYFKHIAILDLIFIALGFIVRIFAGGVIIGVAISDWLLAITFLLALLLATGKRLREIETQGYVSRKVLTNYPPEFLSSTIKTLLPAILISYLFYSFQANRSPYFIFTTLIVVFGLLRYLLLIERKTANENPTDLLLADKQLLISVVLWIIMAGWFVIIGS